MKSITAEPTDTDPDTHSPTRLSLKRTAGQPEGSRT